MARLSRPQFLAPAAAGQTCTRLSAVGDAALLPIQRLTAGAPRILQDRRGRAYRPLNPAQSIWFVLDEPLIL